MAGILVVGDDRDLVDTLSHILHREGYRVTCAFDSETALRLFQAVRPSLVILDSNVPDLGGLDLCRRLRTISTAPIIMLSVASDEEDFVNALASGADDLVGKPFSFRKLLARTKALLRRGGSPGADSALSARCLSSGDCTLDVDLRMVTCHGRSARLTPIEAEILHYLMVSEGQPITTPMIAEHVWGPAGEDSRRLVKVHVCRLRAKLEDDPSNPCLIQTVVVQDIVDLGYCFRGSS